MNRLKVKKKWILILLFCFLVLASLILIYIHFFVDDFPKKSEKNPILVPSKEDLSDFDFALKISQTWVDSIQNMDSLLRKNKDFQSAEVLQLSQNIKDIYSSQDLDSGNQQLRRLAGTSLATQIWRTYNRPFIINHIFSGTKFAELLKGDTHWDIHLAIINLHLKAAELDPELSIGAYFEAANLLMEYVLLNPNLTEIEKINFYQQAETLLSKHSQTLQPHEEKVRQIEPRKMGKFQRLKANILAKSELLGRPLSVDQNWREMLEDSIDLYENNSVKISLVRSARARIEFAHLLAEIDGEEAHPKIRKILDFFFDTKNKEAIEYHSAGLELASSSDYNFHFHKRGLQILGNLDPRFKNLMLENGFEESFFTNFSLPIYPLPPQD